MGLRPGRGGRARPRSGRAWPRAVRAPPSPPGRRSGDDAAFRRLDYHVRSRLSAAPAGRGRCGGWCREADVLNGATRTCGGLPANVGGRRFPEATSAGYGAWPERPHPPRQPCLLLGPKPGGGRHFRRFGNALWRPPCTQCIRVTPCSSTPSQQRDSTNSVVKVFFVSVVGWMRPLVSRCRIPRTT